MSDPGPRSRRGPAKWDLRASLAIVLVASAWLLLRNFDSKPALADPPAVSSASASELPSSPLDVERADPVSEPVRIAESPSAASPRTSIVPTSDVPPPVSYVLRGKVVDDLGAPVRTFIIDATRLTLRRPAALDPSAGTWKLFEGSDGTFTLENLTPAEWQVSARRPVSVRSYAVVASVPQTTDDLVLMLPRPAAIAGIVVDENGGPLSDACVYVWCAGEGAPSFRDQAFDTPTRENSRADESGKFRLGDVQPGKLHVMARHPEFGDNEGIELDLDPGQDIEDLRLVLKRGGRVEGIVDASAGVIAGREVALYSQRGVLGWRDARTDEAGRFAIEGVLPQDYVLELRPADRSSRLGSSEVEGRSNLRLRISVRNEETTRVVIRDERPRAIVVRGSVTQRGRPLSGITIMAMRVPPEFPSHFDRNARTDADGRFELTVDGPGAHRFVVMPDLKSNATFERTVPDAPEVAESFEVPAGRIVGRVLGSDGVGIARVAVTARSTEDGVPSKGWNLQRATTGSDGSFEFGFLEDGTYTVRAPDGMQYDSSATSVAYGRVVLPNVAVQASAERAPIEIRLLPEAWISGQVLDSKGRGVAGVQIQVRSQDGLWLSSYLESFTDSTGTFLVSNVSAGSYTLVAKRGGSQVESSRVFVEFGRAATVKLVLP
jgi:protocatechuate 3,4-dioxygenase beta subunit